MTLASKILAVDDDPRQLKAYERLFSMETFVQPSMLDSFFPEHVVSTLPKESAQDFFADIEMVSASQGEEAIRIVAESTQQDIPFSVAFIDMRMPPGINGLETAQRIRNLDPRIYIVFVTAYSDVDIDTIVEVIKENVLFLHKPFQSDELKQVARNSIQSWQKDRELECLNRKLTDLANDHLFSAMKHDLSIPVLNYLADTVNAQAGLVRLLEGRLLDEDEVVDSDHTSYMLYLLLKDAQQQSILITAIRKLLVETDEQSVCSLESLTAKVARVMPELSDSDKTLSFEIHYTSNSTEESVLSVQTALVLMVTSLRGFLESHKTQSVIEGELTVVMTLGVEGRYLNVNFQSAAEIHSSVTESPLARVQQAMDVLEGDFQMDASGLTLKMPIVTFSSGE